jgi:transcriptional regulator with XRE-family HTH domain
VAKKDGTTRVAPDDALRRTIGENLRAARQQADLSQTELGQLTGVSLKHVSRVERGEANVSVDILNKLAKAVGKTLIEIITSKI